MKVYDNGHEHCMALVSGHEIAMLDTGVVLLGNQTFFYQPRQIPSLPSYPTPLSNKLKSYHTSQSSRSITREYTLFPCPAKLHNAQVYKARKQGPEQSKERCGNGS
jgi:hypothetical protein